jgi:hypothetical protein
MAKIATHTKAEQETDPTALRPDAIKVPVWEEEGRIHATGDTEWGPVWGGVLRLRRTEVWSCRHIHRTRDAALACAWQARGVWLAYGGGDGERALQSAEVDG